MAVEINRDLDRRVTQLAAYVGDRHPAAEPQRGIGVPGVVDANVSDLGLLQERAPDPIPKPGVVQRLVGVRLSREHPG